MKLEDMFLQGKVPMYYSQFFPPNYVCSCGAKLEANKTLSRITCPNPNCQLKLAARLDNILTTIGVKGYSRDSLLPYVKGRNMDTLLLTMFEQQPPKPFLEILKWIKNEPHTMRQVVTAMQLPRYPNELSRVFKGYKNIQDFVDALSITNYQSFIAMKLLRRVTDSVDNMAEILNSHMEEIIKVSLAANILTVATEYDIMITGNINPIRYKDRLYQTKYDFIQLCNTLGSGKIAVSATNSYMEVDYIINDNPNSNTMKAKKGSEYNKLKTTQEFIDIITKEVNIYNGK